MQAYLLREAGFTATRAVESRSPETALTQLNELMSDPKAARVSYCRRWKIPLRAPQHELDELSGSSSRVRSKHSQLDRPEPESTAEDAARGRAGRLASANSAELIRLIGSEDEASRPRSDSPRGSAQVSGSRTSTGKMLTVGEPEMRLAAVTALTVIGSPGAMQMLERADRRDREVRIVAVRALGARNARAGAARIEAAIKGKELRREQSHREDGLLRSVRLLCGDAECAARRSAQRQRFYGKKDDSEVRACAAMAWVKSIRSKRRTPSIAHGEKDVIVRNAVSRRFASDGLTTAPATKTVRTEGEKARSANVRRARIHDRLLRRRAGIKLIARAQRRSERPSPSLPRSPKSCARRKELEFRISANSSSERDSPQLDLS